VVQVESGSRNSRAKCIAESERLEQPTFLHHQQGGEVGSIDHVGLRPVGIGLGEHLGGPVGRATAEKLHLDAMARARPYNGGVDGLGIEACVEHDLALGLGAAMSI